MHAHDTGNVLSSLYTMADVLACCPGMKREDVYYLEQRGYIRPLKQRHGRLERNLFTSQQAELIVTLWQYRQDGMLPRKAYEKAMKERNYGQLSLWDDSDNAEILGDA